MRRVIIEVNGPAQDEKAEAIRGAVDRMLHCKCQRVCGEGTESNVHAEQEGTCLCRINMVLSMRLQRVHSLA